jgi:hypothetical protein
VLRCVWYGNLSFVESIVVVNDRWIVGDEKVMDDEEKERERDHHES